MKITYTRQEIFKKAIEAITNEGFSIIESNVLGDGESVELSGHRIARQSFGKPYTCKMEWPLECFVQCGGDGIVIESGGPTIEQALTDTKIGADVLAGKVPHRRTAFFEAFPKNPATFIRGEGETVFDAEADCWDIYQKILACQNHEFERRDRDDGYCFCKHCGLSGVFLSPLYPCSGCSAKDYKIWSWDKSGNGYCKECFDRLP